jgi:hypothetical protein
MKRALFAFATVLAAITPAAAQYYPYPPPPGYGGGGYYRPLPPPAPGFYRPDYGYGYGYQPRPVQFGNLCVTSRGNCGTRPRPVQSSCSCFIEGFGPKRGAVIAGGW